MSPSANFNTAYLDIADVYQVMRPPSWRGETFALTYILTKGEPNSFTLGDIYKWALKEELPNPRVVSPFLQSWSSLFNPRFYAALEASGKKWEQRVLPQHLVHGEELATDARRTRFYLQSMLFLAGVTLSAAIVQSRWSAGTIASKYDRLWQAGTLAEAGVIPELHTQDLRAQVLHVLSKQDLSDLERLLIIRHLFERSISTLVEPLDFPSVTMTVENKARFLAKRFGFVQELSRVIDGISAIIVYGSSINSDNFADYDVVLVAENSEAALRKLAGKSPTWDGKELNLGVYSAAELWRMQLISGDNLADYGLCIYGSAQLPQKPVNVLLARNMSFGLLRLRQQLGMIGSALSFIATDDGDDRKNLYEYFVKIPANIAKGTFGAVGSQYTKNEIQKWLRDLCGFDTAANQARSRAGDPGGALADAAVATGAVMRNLNQQFNILTPSADAG